VRILVIDDEAGICHVLRACLTHDGHEVACVQRLADGLRALEAASYGIVLLDWTLTDAFGVEALAAVRQAAPDAKVCIVTGVEPRRVTEACADLPPDAILPKPVDVPALLATVESFASTPPCGP
jgi:DNA-binding response OmpR family regulator